VFGWLLVIAGLFALVPVVVDPAGVGWLTWVASGDVRPLDPLVVIAILFLLPVVTKLKVGGVEIEQPAAATPDLVSLQAVSWDAVKRKVQSIQASAAWFPSHAPVHPSPDRAKQAGRHPSTR
jgi:hypothetical protein